MPGTKFLPTAAARGACSQGGASSLSPSQAVVSPGAAVACRRQVGPPGIPGSYLGVCQLHLPSGVEDRAGGVCCHPATFFLITFIMVLQPVASSPLPEMFC